MKKKLRHKRASLFATVTQLIVVDQNFTLEPILWITAHKDEIICPAFGGRSTNSHTNYQHKNETKPYFPLMELLVWVRPARRSAIHPSYPEGVRGVTGRASLDCLCLSQRGETVPYLSRPYNPHNSYQALSRHLLNQQLTLFSAFVVSVPTATLKLNSGRCDRKPQMTFILLLIISLITMIHSVNIY